MNAVFIALVFALLLASCEKEIDLNIPASEAEIVVEAYINDYNPLLNYCILSRTVDYFNPNLNLASVTGAIVYVTEGELVGTDTIWKTNDKKRWSEVLPDLAPGLYADLTTLGKSGFVYKIEIEADGKMISGITSISKAVPIDSISFSYRLFNNAGNPDTSAFMSVHFYEPLELGNNYQAMYRVTSDSFIALWGDLGDGNFPFNDDIINGTNRTLNYSRTFRVGERVHYFLNSVDRPAYNFWDSYNTVRSNGGPFATPASLKSTVTNAIGSFTGYGVSYRQLVIPQP